MRVVSYTRTTSSLPGAEIPANPITEQNDRIKAYADEHGWKISEKYSDRKKDPDENTAFEQLLQDGIRREFDAVIVDSVFHAGNELCIAKEILLQTFHYAGIGFIVVEDNFISFGKSNEEVERYFDEKYLVFHDKKIRRVVNERNHAGILCWSDRKYGYRVTDDNQLVIDEETAPVVKRMFDLCAGGMTPVQIANLFATEKIPIPLTARGTNVKIDDPYKWTYPKVRALLDKTVYIGHWTKVVQGEKIEFTNEPIVDEKVFQKVQEYLATTVRPNHPKQLGKKHRYNGLVRDKELGFCLKFAKTKAGVQYFAFGGKPKAYEGNTWLLLSDLEDKLRYRVNRERERAEQVAARIRTEGPETIEAIISQMTTDFRNRAEQVAESQKEKMDKYMQLGSGKISGSEMQQAEEQYRNVVSQLEPNFYEYYKKKERIETVISENNPWLQLFLTWDPCLPFDRETLHKYVSCITLDHMQVDSIELSQAEWYEALPEDWRK